MLLNLFLFLFGNNFMLFGTALLMVPLGICLVRQKRIRMNSTVILLTAFVVAYLIPEFVSSQRPTVRLLFVPLVFLLGYNYFTEITSKNIVTSYIVIAVGMALHVALTILLTMIQSGFKTDFTAVYRDFWTRAATSTTGLMSNFIMFIPLFVYAMSKKGRSYVLIPFALTGVVFGVVTGNRSTLVLFIVATAVGLLMSVVYREFKMAAGMLAVIILLLLFVFLSYQFNWFGIRTMYDNSYLAYRFSLANSSGDSLLETGRWDIKAMYISKMLDHPWGGGALREEVGSYAHDIWLDTWSSGGYIAFLLLVIYLAGFIYRVINFIRIVEDKPTKILFALYLVVLFMQYFVEPIINGTPLLFMSAVLIDGMISKYLAQEKAVYYRQV